MEKRRLGKEATVKEKKPILKNRFYLYLTEFFAGMSVMAVVGKYIILGISALLIFTVNSNFLIIAGFAA